MEWITSTDAWIALATLTFLEIVLGIDNIVFISILTGRLPKEQQAKARRLGLFLAMAMRVGLLFTISLIMALKEPWFHVWGKGLSGRDIILFVGGLFLVVKSALEIHHLLEGAADTRKTRTFSSFVVIVLQIAVIDIVFSLDSVFTAVGLASPDQVPVMVAAIIVAVLVMMLVSGSISEFVERHPTVKVLALAFLILVGGALMGEGLAMHVHKGILYTAMAFSVAVEMINLRLRKLLAQRGHHH